VELLFLCIHCIFVLNKNELPPSKMNCVIATIMADVPAPKRVRSELGTVCEAYGKHFDTSDGFDKHQMSGYLVDIPCHVLDDGSTRAQLVATSRQTMSTAMLQKLKLARRTGKHIPDLA
jgi:hypothetical protein